MIALILFAIASFFNAVMDTLKFHFETSVFKNKDPKWWNPNVSWKYISYLPYTKYRVDAWHLSKSIMIILFALSLTVGIYFEHGIEFIREQNLINAGIYFILMGLIWNGVFNVFYNKILRRK